MGTNANASSYEELRRKRVEENKKKLEELKLNQLAQSLKPISVSSVKKPRIPQQAAVMLPVRRSSRVAELPPPTYKEVPLEPLGRPRSYGGKRDLLSRVYASDKDRQYALEKAKELQSGLASETPSFVKPMLQSHVTGGFWLGLPQHFCNGHLPKYDEIMTLVDEEGNEWPTKYLDRKNGLSGGWKGFAVDHDLVDGDALVFQLIKPTKFQVYIVRVNRHEDNNNDVSETPDLPHSENKAEGGRKRK
ncbi:B3 domain-containing protein At3g19184-like [Daucus carota subsp. sativus]|uniref:B3 domain-containing protein At3g19184-like n=1 Tax=Daucus carota subsp. sativus TaxID=79200 RepID=UPI0007F00E77|nr:PREDICTED: B3 domain-containing protein At3g19184-like [Daucus carota subsp. sativus]